MKHKNAPKGGASNEQQALLEEAVDPFDDYDDGYLGEAFSDAQSRLYALKEDLELKIIARYSVSLEEQTVLDCLGNGTAQECALVNRWISVDSTLKEMDKAQIILDDVIKCPGCDRIAGVVNGLIEYHDRCPPCRGLCPMSKQPVPK